MVIAEFHHLDVFQHAPTDKFLQASYWPGHVCEYTQSLHAESRENL